jgi:hypothetical protein
MIRLFLLLLLLLFSSIVCVGSDSERNRKRKSTIRMASYLVFLRAKKREKRKRKEISTNVFVKTKRTLQLIGNGRTMNKERKCLTFKTNEKSVCKRVRHLLTFVFLVFKKKHLRMPMRYRIKKCYRWINDDRKKKYAKCPPGSIIVVMFF